MKEFVGLDFETYSAAPLPSVGLKNYVEDETFRPTLAGVATAAFTEVFEPGKDPDFERMQDIICVPDVIVVAHNAGFERAVLLKLGIDIPVWDSAVIAAVAGANRHLRGAAEQLLNLGKLDEDGKLIRLFAIPQEGQEDLHFDRSLITKHPDEWQDFKDYCARDAELSRKLMLQWASEDDVVFEREMRYAQLTLDMNERGWPVAVDEVQAMLIRYRGNLDSLMDTFANEVDPDLNLVSTPQLKEWCEKRGIRAKSFDKEHVDKLAHRLSMRASLTDGQAEVLRMLRVKQAMGGSSLKKLETILDTERSGRVYDQYVHAGAAQSLRTSGRSIQMQNLPRLAHPRDMTELFHSKLSWTNEELSENLRQVFRASDPQGQLVVADYGAIESRALAWLANETWKLDAYRRNEGIYEAQAAQHFKIPVEQVTKEQRTFGKVGELSCGYGAGHVAVKDFAAKMGVTLSEGEAKDLVYGWRDVNARTKGFWQELHDALVDVVQIPGKVRTVRVGATGTAYHVEFASTRTPRSLIDMDRGALSISMMLVDTNTQELVLERVFHGCYLDGNNIGYYKPSALKGGKPWSKTFTNPKTKLRQKYNLYGGKLAGILTQSLCREIFFEGLERIDSALAAAGWDNAPIIGQFHDEVILEWTPGTAPLTDVLALVERQMSFTNVIPHLPMTVDVKHDYRYIK